MSASGRRDEILKELRVGISDMDPAKGLCLLSGLADPDADYFTQSRLAQLFRKLASRPSGLEPLRLALLATSTADHLAKILPLYAALSGLSLELFVGGFDTIHQAVLDPSSELYSFDPDVIWLFTSHRDVHLSVPPGSPVAEVQAAVSEAVEATASLWTAIQNNSSATIIQNNADLPETQVYGNFEAGTSWGRRNLLTRYNLALAEGVIGGTVIFDLDQAAATFGRSRWFDHAMWNHSKHAFSLDAVGLVAFRASRLIAGIRGKAKKCLVLDLDNTLWGGIIGDDGVGGIRLGQGSADGEAFLNFQAYVVDLQRRGIVLAVCSKNDEDIARSPFREHPDMVLSLDDVAVFSANWDNKADNIRAIAETLELGLESLVFFDDNPAERALVREALPMVTVPEAPEDPSLYVACLDRLRLFEMSAYSAEDGSRGQMYRENAARKLVERQATNLDEFLRDLNMEASAGDLDSVHAQRAVQLINKSNQFHLTTTRYSDLQICRIMEANDWHGRVFKLRDRFGDHGLVSVVLMRDQGGGDWLVDTWCMSCRVLSRGMEEFILNHLIEAAALGGARRLVGRYLPTAKNRLVATLYPRLGFTALATDGETSEWALDLNRTDIHRVTFIKEADRILEAKGKLNA